MNLLMKTYKCISTFTHIFLASLTLFSHQASAALIVVNAQFGETGCDLREAIISANTNTSFGDCTAGNGADEILIVPTSISFDNANIVYDNTYGGTGLPHITSAIHIIGSFTFGSSTATGTSLIRSSSDMRGFRFFVVRNGGQLKLNSLSLQGGLANKDLPLGAHGGAIHVACNSSAQLEFVELTQNRARYGGAISTADPGCTFGRRVTVERSVLHNNSAEDIGGDSSSPEPSGGAYYASGGVFSIYDSTISNNSSSGSGGGIGCTKNQPSGQCRFSIFNTTVTNNIAAQGAGGIAASGSGFNGSEAIALNLSNSIVSGNSSPNPLIRQELFIQSPANQSIRVRHSIIGTAQNTLNASTNLSLGDFEDNNILTTSDGTRPTPIDSIIGPLENNSTNFWRLAHEPTPNSPALNAASNSACTNGSKDQIGNARPIGPACDIGSIESKHGEESCFVIPTKDGKTIVFCL